MCVCECVRAKQIRAHVVGGFDETGSPIPDKHLHSISCRVCVCITANIDAAAAAVAVALCVYHSHTKFDNYQLLLVIRVFLLTITPYRHNDTNRTWRLIVCDRNYASQWTNGMLRIELALR